MKNCKNCGHRQGSKCLLSGYYYIVERKHPTICGKNFDGWIEKPQMWNGFFIFSAVMMLVGCLSLFLTIILL